MHSENYHHFFHHGPHFNPHGHGPHMHYPHFHNWLPNYNPHGFPHFWPHYFPPFIPQYNFYHPLPANNRVNNNQDNKNKEKYIPQDDDYDYSELYDFKSNKKEEINQNEIKDKKEDNIQESNNFNLINSEIKNKSFNQENNIDNNNDINFQVSLGNSNDFFLLKNSQQSNNNNIERNIDKNNNEENNIEDNDDINNNIDNSIKKEFDNNEGNENNDENNNQIIIESNHEHPLNYIENLNIPCTICQQTNKNKPGYKCEQCPLILCLNCTERIFYGNKKISIHPHPLLLKFKNEWKCNICEIIFKNTSTFSCDNCGFNVCTFCLIP